MAGYTNYAFRHILRELGGVGLLATEMICARDFLQRQAHGKGLPEQLWRVKEEERPLAVQIWENDPGRLAEVGACLAQEFRVSVVDINFGCPARQVAQKSQSGAYLLRFPERVGALVARVVAACTPTPVTAKIRLGCTRQEITAAEVAQAIEEAGAAALTVHGRTAQDRFGGKADWEAIARLKSSLKRTALIGNGDLRTPADVVEAFRQWPVDGVMIGRAALTRPWIFRQAALALCGEPVPPEPSPEDRRQLLLRHYALIVEQHGPKRGVLFMRRYAPLYVEGLPHARAFRSEVCRVSSPEHLFFLVERFFRQPAMRDENISTKTPSPIEP